MSVGGEQCWSGWLGNGEPVTSHVDCAEHPNGVITGTFTEEVLPRAYVSGEFAFAMTRWSTWRRRLRRWGVPVPLFMTPWLDDAEGGRR